MGVGDGWVDCEVGGITLFSVPPPLLPSSSPPLLLPMTLTACTHCVASSSWLKAKMKQRGNICQWMMCPNSLKSSRASTDDC